MNKSDRTISQCGEKPGAPSHYINNFIRYDSNLIRLLIITVMIFIVMSLLKPDLFLTGRNFSSMSFQFPEYGILAVGMMLSMITGGIDLSMVGIANLSAILAAFVLTKLIPSGVSLEYTVLMMLMAIVLAVGMGSICGLLNGFLIAKVGITPILATLGTMQLFTGIAIVITKGTAIYGFPELFSQLGNGLIGVVPIPLIIFFILVVVCAVILNRTSFGYKMYLIGTNPTASHFSGINNVRVLIRTYLISGLMAAMAGIIMIARTNSAKADYGTSYTMQAILIAVLGGVNPNGGFGTVAGLILAIFSLQFLSSGFNMLRFSNFFKEFIWGAVLLLVMVINYYSNKKHLSSHK
jgi:simple sugar transport system permease protein